ncbi:hypothetical protein AKJ48_03295 [candidate division MSBL1 archaeon SCGC-AAA261O19]|uniref:Uncharacterized protein n=2 Tax=candidate division MSBL1 TaxID=215777 RepID=A0A133V0X4_9EURY|nr:hypothetical protein AKJ42_01645 [candidate division MSBL1 archaeon SCGC-AAA261C02]KXB04179.1 hypothetical protein AKJ48_03295 [candidate division MSBL1 archaeon SCGC-AAA261O19]
MSFRRDQRGFIFSLDATLAVLVALIVLAGVASVGSSSTTYKQHGYLRLERYANDALEVMELTGTTDNIKSLLDQGENSKAESLAENELRKILPNEVQFKLRIGPEDDPRLDNVYPSPRNHEEWRAAFENAEEIAVATRVLVFSPENVVDSINLYVWRGPGI